MADASGLTARPRLVATDLDGTLLRPDGTISDRTARALRRVEASGAAVVFVTARPPRYRGRAMGAPLVHAGAAVGVLHAEELCGDELVEVTANEAVDVLGGAGRGVQSVLKQGAALE